ncbi:3-methyl-2-oxobutanoate hydroxymethyltransferase [Jannaschia sp. LMIT008]|uniref:3-methyl-2-oxobutanoate hydroxymethyltransferase n=1 Tax=Jannaschia maritima TaxID=3032585 RepID=UPI002810B145|nr:3-methyl-2-oxobutanoate hydroxymethyltransferase [Jannaschia sp. LMIT008]
MTARLFDFGGRPVERHWTVASLRTLKGTGRRAVQTTAETREEAAAAHAAGIGMLVCRAASVPQVRSHAPHAFLTAALGFDAAITADEMLRAAFGAVAAGADAVITGRSPAMVEVLAREEIPVMGHLGFVPRKSTWRGRVRAVGRDAAEAKALAEAFRRLEDAGAFAVEAELVAQDALAAIAPRTGLVVVSLGSGPAGEVAFLFQDDVCGGPGRLPRHARAYGDVAALQARVHEERVRALGAWTADVEAGTFPAAAQSVAMHPGEADRLAGSL